MSLQNIILSIRALTLLHSERPKSYKILAFLSAIGLKAAGNTILNNLTLKMMS